MNEDYKYQLKDFIPFSNNYQRRNLRKPFQIDDPKIRYRYLGLAGYTIALLVLPIAAALYTFPEEIGNVLYNFKKGLENLVD